MLKVKFNTKILVALGIMLIAMFILNMNTVNAKGITEEELQAMLDVIPDEIDLDIPEIEYEDKADKLCEQEIKEILQSNSISTEGIEVGVHGPTFIGYIHSGIVTLQAHKSNGVLCRESKDISVKYNNTDKKNATDEKYVKNIMSEIKSPKYYEVTLEDIDDGDKLANHIMQYYSNLVKDDSVIVQARFYSGGGNCLNFWVGDSLRVGIFKNGILYDIKDLGFEHVTVPVINVPNTVPDNEIKDYVINQIAKYVPEYASNITKIEKGTKNKNIGDSNLLNYDIPNGYTVYSKDIMNDGKETEYIATEYIIINRETTNDTTDNNVTLVDDKTNIKLEASSGVVPSNTVIEVTLVTKGTVYNNVKKILSAMKQFKIFDINLLSNGVKIEPNGKVKISIPVPEEFNKSNLVVYRISDNGEKIEYSVTVNGDMVTFETDHFSTYVLAEKQTETEETPTAPIEEQKKPTENKGEKDDTPKTGTIESIYYIIPVTVISALGIIAFRKKETK